MWRVASLLSVVIAVMLAGRAISAQDKYAVKVPDGLAFSEFRGYENWEVVSVSLAEDVMAVIVANPVMIDAYKSGIPGNGQPFPDGSKTAKIHWKLKKRGGGGGGGGARMLRRQRACRTFCTTLISWSGTPKRFPNGNWGYAQFNYNTGQDAFSPEGTGADCGAACHTLVSARDYVFTAYQKK